MKPTLNSKAVSARKNLKIHMQAPMNYMSGQERPCTATEAKNEFGRILDQAAQGVTVVITKHDAPRAVLISVERFNALRQAPQLKLDALTAEFDDLLAGMQTSTARNAMERSFNASPGQLGKAAIRAARKRG
jgi:prevent-host-death family protein